MFPKTMVFGNFVFRGIIVKRNDLRTKDLDRINKKKLFEVDFLKNI